MFCVEDIAAVESFIEADFFFYVIDIVDGSMLDDFARRSVGKYSNAVRPLRYNSQICFVSNINSLFKGIVVHRVTSSSIELVTWSNIWPLAGKMLIMCFQKTFIKSEKNCLTN